MTARITMPQQVTRFARPGELLKRQRELHTRRQPVRSGRETDSAYLELIRQCPCLKCGMDPCGEAAHVRMNSAALGKYQALNRKPSDHFALPLDRSCHLTDEDSQHNLGEHEFWHRLGINPLLVCRDLHQVAGDLVAMRAVVFVWISRREPDL